MPAKSGGKCKGKGAAYLVEELSSPAHSSWYVQGHAEHSRSGVFFPAPDKQLKQTYRAGRARCKALRETIFHICKTYLFGPLVKAARIAM